MLEDYTKTPDPIESESISDYTHSSSSLESISDYQKEPAEVPQQNILDGLIGNQLPFKFEDIGNSITEFLQQKFPINMEPEEHKEPAELVENVFTGDNIKEDAGPITSTYDAGRSLYEGMTAWIAGKGMQFTNMAKDTLRLDMLSELAKHGEKDILDPEFQKAVQESYQKKVDSGYYTGGSIDKRSKRLADETGRIFYQPKTKTGQKVAGIVGDAIHWFTTPIRSLEEQIRDPLGWAIDHDLISIEDAAELWQEGKGQGNPRIASLIGFIGELGMFHTAHSYGKSGVNVVKPTIKKTIHKMTGKKEPVTREELLAGFVGEMGRQEEAYANLKKQGAKPEKMKEDDLASALDKIIEKEKLDDYDTPGNMMEQIQKIKEMEHDSQQKAGEIGSDLLRPTQGERISTQQKVALGERDRLAQVKNQLPRAPEEAIKSELSPDTVMPEKLVETPELNPKAAYPHQDPQPVKVKSKPAEPPKVVDPFEKSNIAISPTVPKEAQGMLSEFMNLFKLGDLKIALLNKADQVKGLTDTMGLRGEGFSNVIDRPSKLAQITTSNINRPNKIMHVISVDLSKDRMPIALEELSHEFGHLLQKNKFDTQPLELQNAVLNAYKDWRDKLNDPSITTRGALKEIFPAQKLKDQSKDIPNYIMDAKIKDTSHNIPTLSTFDEWFAENVAKWAMTYKKPRTIVEKFFSDVAKEIKKIYNKMKGKYIPTDKTLAEWLDGFSNTSKQLAKDVKTTKTKTKGKTDILIDIERLPDWVERDFDYRIENPNKPPTKMDKVAQKVLNGDPITTPEYKAFKKWYKEEAAVEEISRISERQAKDSELREIETKELYDAMELERPEKLQFEDDILGPEFDLRKRDLQEAASLPDSPISGDAFKRMRLKQLKGEHKVSDIINKEYQRELEKIFNQIDYSRGIEIAAMTPAEISRLRQVKEIAKAKGMSVREILTQSGMKKSLVDRLEAASRSMDEPRSVQSPTIVDRGDPVKIRKTKYGEVTTVYEKDLQMLRQIKDIPNTISDVRNSPRSWTPSTHTFDEMGPIVERLFSWPINEAKDAATKELLIRQKERNKQAKTLPHFRKTRLAISLMADAKNVGTRKIGVDAKGKDINEKIHGIDVLAEQGITKIPTLNKTELAAKGYIYNVGRELWPRINEARKMAGKAPMPFRENYYSFMQDISSLYRFGIFEKVKGKDGGPTPFAMSMNDLGKLIHEHRRDPGFRYSKSRNVKVDNKFEMNPFTVLTRYENAAVNYIHTAPVTTRAHDMLGVLKDPKTGERFHLQEEAPITSRWLYNWNDYVAGKASALQLHPSIEKSLLWLGRNMTYGVMSGNLRSAGIQPTALVLTWHKFGTTHTTYGVSKALNSIIKPSIKATAKDRSYHLTGRQFDINATDAMSYMNNLMRHPSGAIRKNPLAVAYSLRHPIGKVALVPMQVLDGLAAQASWWAAEHYGRTKLKLKGKELNQYADKWTKMTQASAGAQDIAPVQRSVIGRTALLFQTFNINQWAYINRHALGIRNPKYKGKKALRSATAIKLVMGMYMMSYLYEDLLDINSPFPRPGKAYVESGQEYDDLIDPDMPRGLYQSLAVAREISELIPGIGGSLKYEGSGAGAALDTVVEFIKDNPEKAKFILGVPGTSQMNKLQRGDGAWEKLFGPVHEYEPKKRESKQFSF